MNLPIADYADYIEVIQTLQRRADQRNNAEANRKLQEARILAEKYYTLGEVDMGTTILRIASEQFIAEQALQKITGNAGESEIL